MNFSKECISRPLTTQMLYISQLIGVSTSGLMSSPTWESRSDRPFEISNRHIGQSSLPPFAPNPDLYVSGNFTTSPQCGCILNWVPSRSPNSLTVSVKARGYSKINNSWGSQVKCLAEIGLLQETPAQIFSLRTVPKLLARTMLCLKKHDLREFVISWLGLIATMFQAAYILRFSSI